MEYLKKSLTPSKENPEDRLEALKEKVLEIVIQAGWEENSPLYNRVQKKTSIVSAKSKTKRFSLMDEKGCEFPAHWDWQEYQVNLNLSFSYPAFWLVLN